MNDAVPSSTAPTVGGDRGNATVFACFGLLALLLIALLLVQFGAAATARHRAQSAADLAALAVAGAADRGSAAACATAHGVVQRMRASVSSCLLDGWDAVVTVRIPVGLAGFGAREVAAVARAGPVDDGLHIDADG